MMSEVNIISSTIVSNVNKSQTGSIPNQPKVEDSADALPHASKVEVDQKPSFSVQELEHKLVQINEVMATSKRAIFFSLDTATGKDVITVTNLTTGDLIRQIPTAEALKAMQNMDTMMGLIFNHKT